MLADWNSLRISKIFEISRNSMEILRISFQNLENPFRIFKILIPGGLGTSAALDPKTTIQKRLETIKSKREGSLRGGDEKVFVFYSGTIFFSRRGLAPSSLVPRELATLGRSASRSSSASPRREKKWFHCKIQILFRPLPSDSPPFLI